MKVLNRTQIPTAQLKPLVLFAVARAGQLAEMASLHFEPSKDANCGPCTGLAQMSVALGQPAPSLVKVWLRDPAAFVPNRQQYVPELEPVQVNTWAEEALLVIAHELRHIVQFWDPDIDLDQHEMEVDAEAFAIETLNAWRSASVNLKRAA